MTTPEAILYTLSLSSGMIGRLINSNEHDDVDAATAYVCSILLDEGAGDYWDIMSIWRIFAGWKKESATE